MPIYSSLIYEFLDDVPVRYVNVYQRATDGTLVNLCRILAQLLFSFAAHGGPAGSNTLLGY